MSPDRLIEIATEVKANDPRLEIVPGWGDTLWVEDGGEPVAEINLTDNTFHWYGD